MIFEFNNFAREDKWCIYMKKISNLDEVEKVEYRLPETYPYYIRTMRNPENQFALIINGKCFPFTVYITVYLKGGTEVHREYPLNPNNEWPHYVILDRTYAINLQDG